MSPENQAWIDEGLLFDRLLEGRDLSPAEIDRAKRGLASTELAIQMDCCAVLIPGRKAPELRQEILTVIDKLQDLKGRDVWMKGNVLLSLNTLSTVSLRDTAELRDFIVEAAGHPEVAVNAALLVGRLAAAGDAASKEIMARFKQGADEGVRSNVQRAYDEELQQMPREFLPQTE